MRESEKGAIFGRWKAWIKRGSRYIHNGERGVVHGIGLCQEKVIIAEMENRKGQIFASALYKRA